MEQEACVKRGALRGVAGHDFRQVVDDAVAVGGPGVREVERSDHLVDGSVVDESGEELGGRQDGERVEVVDRALGTRFERPQGVDTVAPEVDSRRMRVSRAEDVDDAAPAGGCPRLVHDGADAVGHARPLLEGGLHAQLLVGADGLRLPAQQVRGQRLLHQPRHGGDDQRSGVPGSVGRSIGRDASADEPVQRAEGGDALVDGPCLDGQALVGQELGLGELVDRGVVAAVGLELADEAASVVGMRRDDDDGACPAMPERGEDVGLGRLDGGRRQPTASRRDLLAQALEHGQRGKAVDEADEAQFPLRWARAVLCEPGPKHAKQAGQVRPRPF